MTLAAADFAPSVRPATAAERNRRAIRIWLYLVALVIFALVLVGGATRLTESGLSITEWKPIHGIIPPLTQGEWQEEFELYKRIPQYTELNFDMTLDGFKTIFWWEWAHRVLARAVGILFAVPLVFFWATRRIEPFLKPRLVAILALGGLQGFIGWWMVASGLSVRTDVSQYRLATHLTMACIIFAAILWVARGLSPKRYVAPPSSGSAAVGLLILLMALAQIYLGGLVAGLNAGLTYNTWPLMDGRFIPEGLSAIQPAWRNVFENVTAVQFHHRMGAYALLAVVALHALASVVQAPRTHHTKGAAILLVAVVLQAAIGITTLLLVVPIGWALLHQAGGIVVLGLAVIHARDLVGEHEEPALA